jgi:hypothetical protein
MPIPLSNRHPNSPLNAQSCSFAIKTPLTPLENEIRVLLVLWLARFGTNFLQQQHMPLPLGNGSVKVGFDRALELDP